MTIATEIGALETDQEGKERGSSSVSTVKLIVGPAKQEFEVSETRICERCPFFFNAFSGNFLESQTKTLTFPDDDPAHIVDLCAWLENSGSLAFKSHQTWSWLAKLWLFGDKYHIEDLQNAIMDALYAKFAAHEEGINISFETLDYVAENTFPRSPLRRIFADMLANGISLQQLPSRLESIPPEFLQDMCLALKQTVSLHGPTNISLLTKPISTYYTKHNISCKATAMPKPLPNALTDIYCDGDCQTDVQDPEPLRDVMHICTNHNIKLCHDCRNSHYSHRKKMVSLLTPPYRDNITGPKSTIIDAHINDSGFYCDGPKCDPENMKRTRQRWALMSGDRYHCLECSNLDFCSVCIRGDLECKRDGHAMLRIRPTFSKRVPLTEDVTVRQRQERVAMGVCWRCGDDGHETEECDAKEAAIAPDVKVED